MGTRNLVAVAVDGEFKIAQYGQWDGYPSGQGAGVLAFARDNDMDAFAEKCRGLRWLTDEDVERSYLAVGHNMKTSGGTIEHKLAQKHGEQFPALHRDTGADILNRVMSGDVDAVKDSSSFAADSLFCEWAYVLDLDEECLEVYRGFNKEPVPSGQRFSDTPLDPDNDRRETKYYPIVLVRKYALGDLPSGEVFERECDPPEDEIEDGDDAAINGGR